MMFLVRTTRVYGLLRINLNVYRPSVSVSINNCELDYFSSCKNRPLLWSVGCIRPQVGRLK